MRQSLCGCRGGWFLQCALFLFSFVLGRGFFGSLGVLALLNVSISGPEAEYSCGEYEKLRVKEEERRCLSLRDALERGATHDLGGRDDTQSH